MSQQGVCPRGAAALTPEAKRLGYILGLPLVDGVFVMLVLAGMLNSLSGILLVGVVVFAGTGAIAVILADLVEDARRNVLAILGIGIVIVPVAGIQAAIAPTLASVLDTVLLTYVAALVLVILGAEIASPWLRHRSPRLWIVIALGLLVSFRPNGLDIAPVLDPGLAVAGAASAAIGVLMALTALVVGIRVRPAIDRDRFRYAGGIALGLLAASLVSPIPAEASALVMGLGLLFAIRADQVDPSAGGGRAHPPKGESGTVEPSMPVSSAAKLSE